MEDSVKFGKEHREHGGWYIKGRRKDDADVTHSHLIDIRIVDNVDEEGRKSSEERKIGFGKSTDKDIVCSYLFCLIGKV